MTMEVVISHQRDLSSGQTQRGPTSTLLKTINLNAHTQYPPHTTGVLITCEAALPGSRLMGQTKVCPNLDHRETLLRIDMSDGAGLLVRPAMQLHQSGPLFALQALVPTV